MVNDRSFRTETIRAILLLINIFFGIFGSLISLLVIYILADGRFSAIVVQTKAMHSLSTPEI